MDTKAARLPLPSFIPLAHPHKCVCMCMCVVCVCVFLVFLPVFAFRGGGKEGRKEGQRDKSEGSGGYAI